jgi:hypothetical protein
MKFFFTVALLAVAVTGAEVCATEKKAMDDENAKADATDASKKEKKDAYDKCMEKASGCPADSCKDTNDSCAAWAKAGECTNNPKWMNPNCPGSCCPKCTTKALKAGECPQTGDYGACSANSANKDHTCQKWASTGKKVGDKLVSECGANKEWMVSNCMQSCCEACFHTKDGCPTLDVEDVNKQEFKEDGDKVVAKDALVKRCVDKPEDAKYTADDCASWAKKGECTKNPTWMLKNCKKSCCPVCQPTMPKALPTAKPTAKPTAAAVRYSAPVSYGYNYGYPATAAYSGYTTGSYAASTLPYSGYGLGGFNGGLLYGYGR